jgi:hypothetical protein
VNDCAGRRRLPRQQSAIAKFGSFVLALVVAGLVAISLTATSRFNPVVFKVASSWFQSYCFFLRTLMLRGVNTLRVQPVHSVLDQTAEHLPTHVPP